MSHKLDATDRKILRILQSNAKITNAQLSQEVGLSPPPTRERVKKREKIGVIKSYKAAQDAQSIGLEVSTYLFITHKWHKKNKILQFNEAIENIEEVI
jgi:DNA-binding Lrp family transcriptional regulator